MRPRADSLLPRPDGIKSLTASDAPGFQR